jgi:hypothetical protein
MAIFIFLFFIKISQIPEYRFLIFESGRLHTTNKTVGVKIPAVVEIMKKPELPENKNITGNDFILIRRRQ